MRSVTETDILGQKHGICKGSEVREKRDTSASSYRGLKFSIWMRAEGRGVGHFTIHLWNGDESRSQRRKNLNSPHKIWKLWANHWRVLRAEVKWSHLSSGDTTLSGARRVNEEGKGRRSSGGKLLWSPSGPKLRQGQGQWGWAGEEKRRKL